MTKKRRKEILGKIDAFIAWCVLLWIAFAMFIEFWFGW